MYTTRSRRKSGEQTTEGGTKGTKSPSAVAEKRGANSKEKEEENSGKKKAKMPKKPTKPSKAKKNSKSKIVANEEPSKKPENAALTPAALLEAIDTLTSSISSSEDDILSSPVPKLAKRVSPTGSQDIDGETPQEEIRRLSKCTLIIDETAMCVYSPSAGTGGQVLAMNGIPSIEGHTRDKGYVFCFEEASSRKAQTLNSTQKFRMKIFTPLLADTKQLIASIKIAHEQSSGKWLYIREIETGDKRANFGLLLHEMCETYCALADVDKFEIPCAPNFGFFKKDYYLVSNTIQFNLKTMERISYDDCILVSDIKRDSVQFAMCEETNLEQSYQASREVNVEMLSGKSDRLLVYSACCGVSGGKNKKSTAKGAVEMMAENSLTFLPLDDPEKKVAQEVIERGFDGSEITKVKGNRTDVMRIARNCFITNKVVDFNQNYHTKVTFCPERAIEKERLEANRDLKMTVERLAVTHGPKAVLHNLSFALKFEEEFRNHHGKYCSDADTVIPSSVGQYSRWYSNHAHLLMAIKLVIQHEPEWTTSYEEVMVYLKESFLKMITNLRCYGEKIVVGADGEKGDITNIVEKLTTYLDGQGNVKQFLRLTTTVAPAKTVLGIRKAVLDKAGVGSFANELRGNGYEVVNKKNMRFLHENSEEQFFTIGANPVGMCCETTAILVSAEESMLAPLVKLIRDQEKSDGVTSTGKPVTDPTNNTNGEKCAKCDKVGDSLLVCTGCGRVVYCSENCQLLDWRIHGIECRQGGKKIKKVKKKIQPVIATDSSESE